MHHLSAVKEDKRLCLFIRASLSRSLTLSISSQNARNTPLNSNHTRHAGTHTLSDDSGPVRIAPSSQLLSPLFPLLLASPVNAYSPPLLPVIHSHTLTFAGDFPFSYIVTAHTPRMLPTRQAIKATRHNTTTENPAPSDPSKSLSSAIFMPAMQGAIQGFPLSMFGCCQAASSCVHAMFANKSVVHAQP